MGITLPSALSLILGCRCVYSGVGQTLLFENAIQDIKEREEKLQMLRT